VVLFMVVLVKDILILF